MIEKEVEDKSPGRVVEEFLAAAPRDLDQAEALVEEALLAGAEQAEIYLKTSRTAGIFLQRGFATLTGGSERGVALRVFDGKGRWGHAHASCGDPERGKRLVREAMEALRAAPAPPALDVPPPAPRLREPLAPIEGVLDARVLRSEPAERRATIERALRDVAPPRDGALGVSLREGITRVAMVNSEGLSASFQRTTALLTLARDGTDGPTLVSERAACGLGCEEIAEAAAELLDLQEVQGLEEAPPGSMLLRSSACPVMVRSLERAVAGAGEAGPAARVASEAVTLTDDPLWAGGILSSPFDGAGYPSRRRVLLSAGMPASRLPDEAAAGPAGRLARPSYRDLPAPGESNLIVQPGRRSWQDLLLGMEKGVLLAALNQDERENSPEREARWTGIGWEVRQGRRAGPCRRFAFRASARELLGSVREASRSIRFTLHRSAALGCCDLLIEREA